MSYSLRTIGEDGLSENVLIGHSVKYMGKNHPDFEQFKFAASIGNGTPDLQGVFLHPYGHSGYTLAYSNNDYYVVQSNGETYDSYRFLSNNHVKK